MNYITNIMVVGDSGYGHKILDKLATSMPQTKIAFISQAFKSTTTHDYANVKYLKDEVVHIGYRHRLFYCYLKNGNYICGTHLIIASGLNYEPLMINNEQIPCVFNTLDDVPKIAKDQPALVVGNQESDAKFALEVAKKYKQVYLCTKELDLIASSSAATSKKLTKTENLAIVPNTSIQKVTTTKDMLLKVELDNYSEISCSAIYAKTPSKPAIEFIPKKILSREEGYPVVTDGCESTLVPKCFAIGNCLKKYTKTMEQKLIDTILKDF